MTHICVSKLNIIGSDSGLSPGRRQAIIWTNTGILLIWPLGTIFSERLIENNTFLFKKMHAKMSSAERRPFCLGLNMLIQCICVHRRWVCFAGTRRVALTTRISWKTDVTQWTEWVSVTKVCYVNAHTLILIHIAAYLTCKKHWAHILIYLILINKAFFFNLTINFPSLLCCTIIDSLFKCSWCVRIGLDASLVVHVNPY